MTQRERQIDELYGAPLEEFTERRNELAKRLDDAEIKALRKPTRAAWTINQLARQDPARVKDLLKAGDRLREAQRKALRGQGAETLRAAGRGEQEAVDGLVAAARKVGGTDAMLERVRQTLHTAAGDEEVAGLIERGRVSADHEPIGLGPFEASAPQSAPPRRTGESAKERARSKAATKRRAEARRRLDQAEKELLEAEAGLEEARAEAERIATELRSRERAAERARKARDSARAALEKTEPG